MVRFINIPRLESELLSEEFWTVNESNFNNSEFNDRSNKCKVQNYHVKKLEINIAYRPVQDEYKFVTWPLNQAPSFTMYHFNLC